MLGESKKFLKRWWVGAVCEGGVQERATEAPVTLRPARLLINLPVSLIFPS